MQKEAQQKIKLVNMNVWFGMDGRGLYRIGEYEPAARRNTRFAYLASGLQDLDPDIIALQEANKLPGYARRMARIMDYDAVWKVQNSGLKIIGFGIPVNFTAGNVILAKKGVDLKYLASERLSGTGLLWNNFSFHFTEMRNAMAAMVVICGHPLLIFNTQVHFSLILNDGWVKAVDRMSVRGEISDRQKDKIKKNLLRSHNRTEQDIIRLIGFIRKMTEKHNFPFIVTGDFNTTLESPALKKLVDEFRLLDPYRIKNPDLEGYTWDPAKNTNSVYDGSPFWADGISRRDPLNRLEAEFDRDTPRRIDFIFLSNHFSAEMIEAADLLFTESINDLHVSDHFGIQVVLNDLP